MENTIENLKKFKFDAILNKRKHFNAAARKLRYHYFIGYTLTILSTIVGATTVADFVKEYPNLYLKQIIATSTVLVGIFSGLQTFLNLQKLVEGHKRVGNAYLALSKRTRMILSFNADGELTPVELKKYSKIFTEAYAKIHLDAENYHTTYRDYKKALNGIKNGEETYTKEELEV